ncbi:Penicillin-binding protein 1A [Flavobacterium saliperosum S13]|uniref:Penicillin-binding protein 1A n=2 Tax=Flavobacterium saliperosum TaxID=329186 RepID=A0A1G4W3Z2_9FLAO|nr:PBP1A family penicillin-binding protein [Flavobacterium saliperosum]ESU26133.1 Penicillin-binding protein 1A [Flavobacterium saliperosum S13]SCX16331.1 penicillin-binding protein 1A [Flavobacterium saliperosum]
MAQINNKKEDFSPYVKKFWKLFFYCFGGVILFFLFASWGLFGSMPSFDELENPNSNVATEIISSDGVTIGKFYLENRTPVKFAELPDHLVKALVATEDERFYEHSGIDTKGTLRAALSLGSSGGASTLTQQLAKNLFHGEGSKFLPFRIIQKAKEWIIATKLERQYTKKEIIAHYLNTVDFVNTAVGIRSASKVYFGKEPKDLTVDEAAMFVGMLKNPSLFNPVRRLQKVTDRRNVVLHQMEKNKFLTKERKEFFQAKPIVLKFTPESHIEGSATYFREYLRDFMKKWVKENPKKDGDGEYDIYRDGLKIYTTIDSRMQQYAEEAASEHLANLQGEFNKRQKDNPNAPFIGITPAETKLIMQRSMKNSERWRIMNEKGFEEDKIVKSFEVPTKMKIFTWKGEKDTLMTPRDSILYYKHFLQTGMMAMEPQTGHVKAWVGGINYKHFQYDHVGQGARQVGSTFKPFLYATAIEQLKMSPCDSIYDSPFTMPKGRYGIDADWSPKNSTGNYRGMVNLKSALANSINTVSAKLIDKVGPEAVVDMTKKLGVSSEIPVQPSIALGAVDITVEQMVAAFSTFANQGVYMKPQVIVKIVDKNGVLLYEPVPESRDVMSKDVAYTMIKLMEGVTEYGTGSRLRWGSAPESARVTGVPYNLRNPIAGKTGTSQNNSDGWFIGMVPNLAAGIWVGNEDRSAHFEQTNMGQGATMALPIWGIFMRKCYEDDNLNVSQKPFEKPENYSVKVDCWVPKKAVVDSLAVEEDTQTEEFDF